MMGRINFKWIISLRCQLALVVLSLGLPVFAQIKWTEFEHLNDSLRQEAKPILVFIHAEWCAYCKLQENETFTRPAVVQKLNQEYYCLKLDAEGQEDITFLGRPYRFVSTGYRTGQHELAQLLGAIDEQLTLPTTLVLSEGLQLQWREASFLAADFLLERL